ncbi:hypothetical protein QAD02_022301, partial [Eretmocerus hayati]
DVKATMQKNWLITTNELGPDGDTYRDILLDMASKAHNYTRRYGILMYSTASMYFMSPFAGMQNDNVRARKYPFFGWYYFDKDSDLIYALCYISQLMIGVVVGTCNYAMDSIFLVAVYHCCAQLRMIQYDVQKLGQTGHCSHEEIAHLVRKHQMEIRTSRKLEIIFNGCSVQQLMVSCVIICIIGFKLIIALSEGGSEFLVYIAFMFVALLQIFLYCKPGDELISQSIAVADATYQSLWRRLDVELVRKVSMMILRSQRPLKMTAGSFLVLSMPNFTK